MGQRTIAEHPSSIGEAKALQAVSAAAHLLVGLGNPGRKHAKNRHNVGQQCLALLAGKHGLTFQERVLGATLTRGKISDMPAILAQPRSFVNQSGPVVGQLMAWQNLALSHLLIITDDMDLPLGKLRLRPWGGAGGHRGLLSIIENLGTDRFSRLRIGIERPPQGVAPHDYVLADFTPQEREVLAEVLTESLAAIECFLREGIVTAMNRYN